MATTYKVVIASARGVDLYTVNDVTGGLDYVIAVNQVGRCKVTLDALAIIGPTNNTPNWPGQTASAPINLSVDMAIQVWRSPDLTYPGAIGATIPGPPTLERVFFVKEWTFFTDDKGQDRVLISGPCSNGLLTDEIVAFTENSAGGTKTATADNLMKAFVRENLGPSASPAGRNRDAAYWSVEADTSLGATITLKGSKLTLLRVCQDACDASRNAATPIPLYFDVVPVTPSTFQFRTFKGQRGRDRSLVGPGQVVLSADRGTLSEPRAPQLVSPELTEDWDEEYNQVYTTGIGTDIDNVVLQTADATRAGKSIWGRRSHWENTSDEATDQGVPTRANAALAAGRPRRRFSAEIANVTGARYGIDWMVGDRLAAQYHGASFNAMVNAVHVSVGENGVEKVTGHFATVDD